MGGVVFGEHAVEGGSADVQLPGDRGDRRAALSAGAGDGEGAGIDGG
ncbi:hypothetical protein [Actinomadura coerulea]